MNENFLYNVSANMNSQENSFNGRKIAAKSL